jgi:putative PIN family toxin of toxin-antitoxin system
MIRVVIDTNIIVSALLQPLGPPAQILMLALNGVIQICITGNIYAEYEEVLRRARFRLDEQTIVATLDAIRSKAFWVKLTDRVTACSDQDDNMFLECAQAANADYLVTGNLKHFPTSWVGTRVVPGRWLLDAVSARSGEESV